VYGLPGVTVKFTLCIAVGVAPNMMATQYYGIPGATPPSWGMYPPQNAVMSGQQTPTPGTPGTPQPTMMRSQSVTRSVTPQHQQQDGLTATALPTAGPGLYNLIYTHIVSAALHD